MHSQRQSRRGAPVLQRDSAGHDEGASQPTRYCPAGLLDDFALLMAGHGRCVSTSMMLGDRGYAMEQLARARAMHDLQLQVLAARLSAYFDNKRSAAPA